MYYVTDDTTETVGGVECRKVTLELCPHITIDSVELFGGAANVLPEEASVLDELRSLEAHKNSGALNFYGEAKAPCVFAYLRQYVEENPDKFVYNSQISELVKSRVNVPVELHRVLDTAVYLAQRALGKLKKGAIIKSLLADGYVPFCNFQPGPNLRVVAQIQAKNTSEYHFTRMEGRLVQGADGRWFVLPKGKRNRGFVLSGEEVYIKTQASGRKRRDDHEGGNE